METNAKVPPVQPVTEPPQPEPQPGLQSKPDSTASQDPQSISPSSGAPAYIAEPLDYRLVIDKDPISGTFIYRTVDRLTGETVAQFPNEEIVRLRDSADYQVGTVFNGKV